MKKKSILHFLCLALVLCLCACGRNGEDADAALQSGQEQMPAREYESTYREFFIPEELDGNCNIVQITGDAFYLTVKDHAFCDFYRVSLEEKELIPAKLPFGLSDKEYEEGFYVCEEGGYLICRYDRVEQQFYLCAYDEAGALSWERNITEEVPETEKESDGRLCQILQDAAGNIYLRGDRHVLVFTLTGDSLGCISVPFSYITDLVRSREGAVYALSDPDTGGAVAEYRLVKLEAGSASVGQERTMKGNPVGMIQSGSICVFDTSDGQLCEYDPEEDRVRGILDYARYDIATMWVHAFHMQEGRMRFIFWEYGDNTKPMEILTLTKPESGEVVQEQEKEQIRLISLNWNSDLSYRVQSFNRKNDTYQVVVEVLNKGELSSYREVLARLNTYLVSDKADLVMLSQQEYCNYKEKQVFADLTPYLEDRRIKEEDYLEELVEPLKYQGELYTLPTRFSLRGYALRKTDLGDRSICTMEDFLDYLEQHPETKLQWGGGKFWVLETCMKFGWERFVDRETGKCYFDGEEFKELMRRIAALELDTKSYDEEWDQLAADGHLVFPELHIDNLVQVSAQEALYNDELCWIGYPGADGQKETYVYLDSLLCILEESEKKDGAFAFWEYYMQHQEDEEFLSAKKVSLEKQRAYASEPQYKENELGELEEVPIDYFSYSSTGDIEGFYALNEWQNALVEEMFATLRLDETDGVTIQSIIIEEMRGYLMGSKTLDEVTDIVQSRVQLYLYERK